MGLLDKVKIPNITSFFGLSDDEYEDYEGDVDASTLAFSTPAQGNVPKAAGSSRKSTPIRVQQGQAVNANQNRQEQPIRQQVNARTQQQVRVTPTSQMQQTPIRQQAAPMRQQHARPAQMPSPQNQFARVERRTYESALAPRIPQASSRPDTKVVDLHSASRASSTSNRNSSSNSNTKKKAEATLKIAIKEPRVYSEATDIGKILMANDAVLVNFHLMEEHSAARCVDFFTGITYAIDGDIQRVGNQVFLCTPASIQIDGNQARSLLHEHNFDL